MSATESSQISMMRKILAWSVHLLTASGVVWGFWAVIAIFEGDWQTAMLLLGLTTLIDGVDGSLSRLVQVKRVLPNFDGALLDNIVDYFTYVVVPAIFVYQAQLVPEGWLWLAPACILLASSYQFAQADAKTEDHYFKGFPSYWNIVVIYFVLWQTAPLLNLIILLACAVMVFVPIKYLYPSRMQGNRGITMVFTFVWMIVMAVILWQYPTVDEWLLALSLLYAIYYVGMSLWANLRPLAKQRGTGLAR